MHNAHVRRHTFNSDTGYAVIGLRPISEKRGTTENWENVHTTSNNYILL